jgi:hypothetical protein
MQNVFVHSDEMSSAKFEVGNVSHHIRLKELRSTLDGRSIKLIKIYFSKSQMYRWNLKKAGIAHH